MRISERQRAIGVHFVLPSELDLSDSRGCNVFLIWLEAGTEGRSFPVDTRFEGGQELKLSRTYRDKVEYLLKRPRAH